MSASITVVAEYEETYADRLTFSPSGALWAAANSGEGHIWQGRERLVSFDLSGEMTGNIHFSQDEHHLYLSPLIYDLHARQFVDLPPVSRSLSAGLPVPSSEPFNLQAAAWHPAGTMLAVYARWQPSRHIGASSGYSGPRKRLLLLDGPSRELRRVLREGSDESEYETLAFSSAFLAAGGMPTRVWEAREYQSAATVSGHTTTLRALCFNADSSRLATAGWDGQVNVWETTTWRSVSRWTAHDAFAGAVAFHPLQPWLATGGGDGQLKLWRIGPPPELLAALKTGGNPQAIAFHPGGTALLAALEDEHVVEYRLTL